MLKTLKKKILVIDDSPDTRTILNAQLSSHGYQVFEAADHAAALEMAKAEHPDLVILDLMMPRDDGFKTYHALRQDAGTKPIPVIFLTALSWGSTLSRRSLELFAFAKQGIELEGDYRIVGKPYQIEDLLHEIQRALTARVNQTFST